MTKEEIIQKQKELDVLYSAWMAEKMKKEVLTFKRKTGETVRHYPDGREEIIRYAH